MVNKKDEGLIVLNEILLRMSYDMGKTLSEQKLPLDYYYYNDKGQLKTLPNLVTNYPKNSVPAKEKFPNITNPEKFPKTVLPNTLKSFNNLDKIDTRSYSDATQTSRYVGPTPKKTKTTPQKIDTKSYSDNTRLGPKIDFKKIEKFKKLYEKEKKLSKPKPPQSEQIIYDPNTYPKPTPKWVYNGKKYDKKQEAFSLYEKDRQKWVKNYGKGFESWVLRNSETIHNVLGLGALGLALISMGGLTLLTGGAAAPIAGLSLEAMTGLGSLLLTAPDVALYAYEGDKRMAIFVALLSVFDVSQIVKAVKGMKVTANEIKTLKQKAISNADGLSSGMKKESDVFTPRERLIMKNLDGSIISKEGNIITKRILKQSIKELGELTSKSANNFSLFIKNPFRILKTIPKIATTLGSFVLVIDGIQISYNLLYNLLNSENEKVLSLAYSLIQYALTKPNVQKQIIKNNQKLESTVGELPTDQLEKVTKVITDYGVSVKEGSLSMESILSRMNKREKKILPGIVKTYGGSITKKTPFTSEKEGNKFRKWFNDNFSILSSLIELDPTGPFDNSYIRRAFNAKLPNSDETAGDIYLLEMEFEDTEEIELDKNGTTSGSMG